MSRGQKIKADEPLTCPQKDGQSKKNIELKFCIYWVIL